MVKPPRTMQPEWVDLRKAGRAQRKAFTADSFASYMARKIDMQRKQFGCVLPPPPQPTVTDREEEPWRESGVEPPPPSPPQQSPPATDRRHPSRRVTFALDAHRAPQGASPGVNSLPIPRKRRTAHKKAAKPPQVTAGLAAVLRRLKRRHGDAGRAAGTSGAAAEENGQAADDPGTEPQQSSQPLQPTQLPPPQVDENFEQANRPRQSSDLAFPSPLQPNNLDSPESTVPSPRKRPRLLRKLRPDLFFFGVVVLINGYTEPDPEALQRLLHRHGGDVEKYETSRVTHVVAAVLSQAKANFYKKRSRSGFPVVRPEWIVDSAAAGRLLPHQDYLLDQLRDVTDGGRVQPISAFLRPLATSTKSILAAATESGKAAAEDPATQQGKACTVPLATALSAPRGKIRPLITAATDSSAALGVEERQSISTSSRTLAPPRPPPKSETIDLTGSDSDADDEPSPSRELACSTVPTVVGCAQPLAKDSDTAAAAETLHSLQLPTLADTALDSSDTAHRCAPASRLLAWTPYFVGHAKDTRAIPVPGVVASPFLQSPRRSPPPSPREGGTGMEDEPSDAPSIELVQGRGSGVLDPTTSDSLDCEVLPNHHRRTDDKYIDGRVRTVGTDPNFLKTFFQASRLSFIGAYKQRTRQSPSKGVPRAQHRSTGRTTRFVFHVDMDSFFASVVLRNFPQYRGKPVAISHNGNPLRTSSSDTTMPTGASSAAPSTSECATCNYIARTFGVKKGMFLGRAKELCPDLVILPYDFEGYEEVSEQVADILFRYAASYNGAVEQVSCDESYVELHLPTSLESVATVSQSVDDMAENLAASIRTEIFQATDCTASIGIASNKLLAKLGTDSLKPKLGIEATASKGYALVRDHRSLLAPLRLRQLPGIGYHLEYRLLAEGLQTVQDVWDLGSAGQRKLEQLVGVATGKKVYAYCQGQDDRPVAPVERKTIGAECSYGVRFNGPYGPGHMLDGLAQEVEERMVQTGVKGGRKITLKLKIRQKNAPPPHKYLGHGHCYNLSKSCDVPGGIATNGWQTISKICCRMFEELDVPTEEVRGMGITLSKLDLQSTSHPKEQKEAQAMRHWLAINSKSTSRDMSSPPLGHTVTEARGAACWTSGKIESSPTVADLDFALPPMSQLHMSQVDFLPSPLKNSILATVEASKLSGSTLTLNIGASSRTKIIPEQRKLFSHARSGRESSRKSMTEKAHRSRLHGGSRVGRGNKQSSRSVATVRSVVDCCTLFEQDILPLSAFLDANPEADVESTNHVASFLVLCTEERLLTDVVTLLRCVKKRKDRWGVSVYESLLARVNDAIERRKGFRLDSSCI